MQSRTSWTVASSFWTFLGWSGIKILPSFRPQALVYDQPGFQGSCLEIDADVFSFCESEAGFSAAGAHVDSKNLKSVGSLKVIGGLWVFFFPFFSPLTHCCCWTGTSGLRFIGFPRACITKTDANPWRRSSSSSPFLLRLQLGGLQRGRVRGAAAHPGGRGVPGLQRLGRLGAAALAAAGVVCE